MSSGNDFRRHGGIQAGIIVKSRRRVMSAYDTTLDKDYFLSSAVVLAINLSELGYVCGK